MHIEIGKIADIIAGYAFRGAIEPDMNGEIAVFQAKDLVAGEPLTDTSTLTKISQDIPEYAGHLKKNDVLLTARGLKSGSFRSTVFYSDDSNILASSSVHVIRVTDNNVLPDFLSLYLNSKSGQNALADIVTGSYIGVLPRKRLESMEIPLPSLQTQELLIKLQKNFKEQQKIINHQNEIKTNIISETFKHLLA